MPHRQAPSRPSKSRLAPFHRLPDKIIASDISILECNPDYHCRLVTYWRRPHMRFYVGFGLLYRCIYKK